MNCTSNDTTFDKLPPVTDFRTDVDITIEYNLMEKLSPYFDGFANCPIGIHNDRAFQVQTHPVKTIENFDKLLTDLKKHGELVLYYITSMPIIGCEKVYGIRLAIIEPQPK